MQYFLTSSWVKSKKDVSKTNVRLRFHNPSLDLKYLSEKLKRTKSSLNVTVEVCVSFNKFK